MADPAKPSESDQVLSDHVVESMEALAAVHREHYRQTSPLQRGLDRITHAVGTPSFVASTMLGLAGWAAISFVVTRGRVTETAFVWLELTATLAALVIAMLILVTQRREDQLAERRAQLTLELAMLADRKSAKIIALLEELRRDHPDLVDRVDTESDEMASPTDPSAVLAAVDAKVTADSERS